MCSRCNSFRTSRSALASSTLSYSPAYRNIGLSLTERSFPLLRRSISPHLAILRSCLRAILVSRLCLVALLHVDSSLDYHYTERKGSSLLRTVTVVIHVPVEVLLHGVLDPLPGNQENSAPADVHAVVGDALQVVDHQGRTHPPLRGASSPLRRVGYEIHGLRVEEVNLVVLRLEVAGPLYVAVLEYVETLVEYVAGSPGHLHEGSLQVLVTLAPFCVHDRVADVLAEGA